MSRHAAWRRAGASGATPRPVYVRILWFALAGLAVAVMLRGGVYAVSEGYRTSAAVLELEEDLTALQREHDALQSRYEFLGTPEGRRLEVAHQLRLVRPGERLLTLRSDEETEAVMSEFDSGADRSDQPAEVIKRWAHTPEDHSSTDR